MKYSQTMHNKGFVSFFAVVIVSALLLVGLSVADTTFREVQLGSASRDSSRAFFAADSGAECALYFDRNEGAFASQSTGFQMCHGIVLSFAPVDNGQNSLGDTILISSFDLPVIYAPGSINVCARVTITKNADLPNGTQGTVIESRGFNVPCTSIIPTISPSVFNRLVERGVRIRYSN